MMRMGRRMLGIGLAVLLMIAMLPSNAFAWKNMTHVNSANILLLELQRSAAQRTDGRASLTIYASFADPSNGGKTYLVPEEYQEALLSYPDAFRAGSMGPDYYPDIVTGQTFIHPYEAQKDIGSGEWITLLCDSVNQLPRHSEERKEALAFTLGVMLHFCGDLYGHDFINMFTGGAYPSLFDINWLGLVGNEPELNYMLSHMAEETYMDSLVNFDFYSKGGYLKSHAPTRFVADTMVYDGSAHGGRAKIYDRYGSVPMQYSYLINLRTSIYRKAEEWRESTNPLQMAAVAYMDAWINDIDQATFALVDCFDQIAQDMIIDSDPSVVGIMKERMINWINTYGKHISPVPDAVVDLFADVLSLFNVWKTELITNAVMSCAGISESAIKEYAHRLEDPEEQLDHYQNPYDPTGEKRNFDEFKEYMDRYAAEQKRLNGRSPEDLINGRDGGALDALIDSELEAFYNTMVMFKLVLIGPENFTAFIRDFTGITQMQYQMNSGSLSASSVKLNISTTDTQNAGTDDNVFAVVYRVNSNGKKTKLIRKLLDISASNDFEAGDKATYIIELPEAVPVDEIEISLEQEEIKPAYSGWDCARIDVIPMHAGIELIPAVGVGGNAKMDSGKKWDLRFQDALKARELSDKKQQTVMNLRVTITTADKKYAGTDDDIYLIAYNTDHPETEWVKVLLDKTNYNDFERNDKDTYEVSLTRYISSTVLAGIPLDKLGLKIKQKGRLLAGSAWNVENVTVTPYYGNLQLTESVDLGGKADMDSDVTWDLGFKGKTLIYKDYAPLTLTYPTAVDDGILSFMNSLDESTQWVDKDNILWANKVIRENVFFSVFKGFAPEIDISEAKVIYQADPVDMSFNFRGKWNGVFAQRRNAGVSGMKAPRVTGSALVSLIDADTRENQLTITLPIEAADSCEKAVLDTLAGEVLLPGAYDIKVAYLPDDEINYNRTEKVFLNALTVLDEDEVYIRVRTDSPAGGSITGEGIYTKGDIVTVEASASPGYRFVGWMQDGVYVSTDAQYQFPAYMNHNLTAVFEQTAYTVTFDANGGTGAMAAQIIPADVSQRLTLNLFTREDYLFDGWNTCPDGSGAALEDGAEVKATADTILYAQWIKVSDARAVTIVKEPADQYIVAGQCAEFEVVAEGKGLTYQWYVDRGNGLEWCKINGSTASVHQTNEADLDCDGYLYRCVITDRYGVCVTSEPAALFVSETPYVPGTGDEASPLLWLAMSLLGLAGLLILRREVRI